MKASKQFLKDNNILPRVKFKGTGLHTVVLLNDKPENLTDFNGEVKPGVAYLVEEKGENKTIRTSAVSLIEKLSSFNPGDTVEIELKSKNFAGKVMSVYEVKLVKEADNNVA